MKKFILPLVCAAFLAACAGARVRPDGSVTARPDWADGSSAAYPRSRFLTGIGSADDLGSAKDRARGEISRIFATQVTMNTSAIASEQTSSQGGKSLSNSAQDVMESVRATSSKMLEGVEVVQTWHDSSTRQYYALAVLDRAKALAALSGKLEELDASVDDVNKSFSAAMEKMAKAKFAMKLLSLFKGRESLTADMRVLNPGGSTEPSFNINYLRRASADALAALDVAVTMSGDSSDQAAAEIIKTLNGMGIQAKTGAGSADIAVDCAAKFEPMADPDVHSRWKWYRASATISLKDVKASKIFLSADVTAKEAAATAAEAKTRTEASLGKKVGAEITKGITAYFENQ